MGRGTTLTTWASFRKIGGSCVFWKQDFFSSRWKRRLWWKHIMCSERYGGVFALAFFETLKGYGKTRCLQTDRVYSIWTIEFILTNHTVDGKNPENHIWCPKCCFYSSVKTLGRSNPQFHWKSISWELFQLMYLEVLEVHNFETHTHTHTFWNEHIKRSHQKKIRMK